MPATFTNDILTVHNALVTLCGNATDPNGGDTVTASRTMSIDGILDSVLPYIWVRRGRHLNRDERSSDLYNDTRQFQVLVYVNRLSDGEHTDETEFDNASNWIKYFHKYLAQNRAVTSASHIVVQDVRDSGDVNLFTKQAIRYSGVVFTVPVSITTRF